MIGRNNLTTLDVLRRVMRDTLGVFVVSNSEEFEFIGRSDTELRNHLLEYIGKYQFFWFEYTKTIKDGYLKQCTLYHEHEPKDNPDHPVPPPGARWPCPVCKTQTWITQ